MHISNESLVLSFDEPLFKACDELGIPHDEPRSVRRDEPYITQDELFVIPPAEPWAYLNDELLLRPEEEPCTPQDEVPHGLTFTWWGSCGSLT